jgi:hypothetical protein
LPPSKISSPNGSNPTIPSADYAQLLKTLCLDEEHQRIIGDLTATIERLGQPLSQPDVPAGASDEYQSDVSVSQSLDEIRFDYLPESPIERKHWVKAYGTGIPTFKVNPEMRGLSMEVTGGEFAMDYRVPDHATLCDRLRFTAKYTRDSTMIFTGPNVASKDGSQRRTVWIKYYHGDRPPEAAKDVPPRQPTRLPEQTVWINAVVLQGGWMAFDIALPSVVRSALGSQGWVYNSLCKIRLRGCLSISPISLLASVSGRAAPIPIRPRAVL